ncbi:MAG TPA: hypothetical protein VN238_12940 [Solirubrobacteraceae bacterium]|nr:hypothetical protein [Solirubrobacteraceae bacterium]
MGASSSSAGSSSYGRGARILSVGIAVTGLVTFAFFAVASHVLDEVDYKAISLLWSVVFVVVSVIYRPIEQLLSRSIAERRAHGLAAHSLRTPLLLQACFALVFLVVALVFREPLEDDVFDGATTLYWVLVGSVLAYAASYFARGWLAGNQQFALYGGLVLVESSVRFLFPLLVAVGLFSGQSAVAMGILAAPLLSLVVVPAALSRTVRPSASAADADLADAEDAGESSSAVSSGSLREGGQFAVAVFLVMLAEQTIINAPVLVADATASDAALAGFVFNALLIARAPLQLFQAIQTSLLPHLASLNATSDRSEFDRAIRVTVLAIAGFAGACALGLLALGPWVMDLVFGGDYDYGRVGLAVVALGMGFHLAAGTLNQAALARGHQRTAAGAWLFAAVLLVAWIALPIVDDELVRVETGYALSTAVLCALLAVIYRR